MCARERYAWIKLKPHCCVPEDVMHGLLLDFIIFKRGRKRGKEMSGQTQISCLFANDRGGLPCDISYIIYIYHTLYIIYMCKRAKREQWRYKGYETSGRAQCYVKVTAMQAMC